MGADIEFKETQKQVIVNGGRAKNPLKGIEIDCSDIPDLFPILSVVGAFASGKTVIYNAQNLRLKESDRISSMARELNKMGVRIKEEDDRLTIYHCQKLNGSIINHDNDHRIAMACTIAALFASSNSYVENIDIVKDSYPTFLDDLQKIGIQLDLK
jgi:3-phosphoshikimate 1-carboxyvinyltransferase